jgi:hypothetical protein
MSQKNQNKSKPKTTAAPQIAPSPADITPLSQFDGQKLQEMVDLNNTYGSLVKQKGQYDAALGMLKIRREQVAKGEISLPVMIQISRAISHAESNKDKVLRHFDDEIRQLEMAKQGITGTLEHRRDEYIECVLRVSKLLSEKVKDYQIKGVSGVRTANKEIEDAEKVSMEKELEKLLKTEKA